MYSLCKGSIPKPCSKCAKDAAGPLRETHVARETKSNHCALNVRAKESNLWRARFLTNARSKTDGSRRASESSTSKSGTRKTKTCTNEMESAESEAESEEQGTCTARQAPCDTRCANYLRDSSSSASRLDINDTRQHRVRCRRVSGRGGRLSRHRRGGRRVGSRAGSRIRFAAADSRRLTTGARARALATQIEVRA